MPARCFFSFLPTDVNSAGGPFWHLSSVFLRINFYSLTLELTAFDSKSLQHKVNLAARLELLIISHDLSTLMYWLSFLLELDSLMDMDHFVKSYDVKEHVTYCSEAN